MNDRENWLDRLGQEFDRISASERAKRSGRPALRVVVVALATLALMSSAAYGIASTWDSDPPEPSPASGIVATSGEPVTSSGEPESGSAVEGGGICEVKEDNSPTDQVADQALVGDLSVLSDGKSETKAEVSREGRPIRGYSRIVNGEGGLQFKVMLVAPTEQVITGDPSSSACRAAKRANEPARSNRQKICLEETSIPDGGVHCGRATQIASGDFVAFEDRTPGSRAGEARVFGLAPDGVNRVRLRFRTDSPVEVPVRSNVFAYIYNGSAAVPPTITFIR